MNLEKAARALAELGNTQRLRIFRVLVRAGPKGLSITEIRNVVGMAASTLAFHLRGMVEAGLVIQERQGREVRCRADYELARRTVAYIMEECCRGAGESRPVRRTG